MLETIPAPPLVDDIRDAAHPLRNADDLWPLMDRIGDARYVLLGEVNVGQLTRERHGRDDVVLVGFSGHHGSVIAGTEWDAPMERMPVPEAVAGSWEDLLHQASPERKLLILNEIPASRELMEMRGHRAIGVVYHPQFERYGNYVPTVLPHRYDSLLYIEDTHALHPLRILPKELREVPETFPWGL